MSPSDVHGVAPEPWEASVCHFQASINGVLTRVKNHGLSRRLTPQRQKFG
ncbi:hypothetical protein HanIR_Chr17g0888391 [Helianthus annuus]|nr:hypothetical protein HanIR_Chr17g0888391 [Helianthus annuus]